MRTQQTTGFTLVEIVVVLTILTVVAAIIVPIFATSGQRVNQQSCMNNLREIGAALAQYRQDHDVYPCAPLPEYLDELDPKYVPFGQLPTWPYLDPMNTVAPADSLVPSGPFTGANPLDYVVKVVISALGANDAFRWSDDGELTWHGPYSIVEADKPITLDHGLAVAFASVNGHATSNVWTIKVEPKLPADWRQWQPSPVTKLEDTALANTDIIDVQDVTCIFQGDPVILRDKDNSGITELAIVASVDAGNTSFTTALPLTHAYQVGSIVVPAYQSFSIDPSDPLYDGTIPNHFVAGNFGLTRLMSPNNLTKAQFHCPAIQTTEDVQQNANLLAVTDTGYKRFDPLWSGYNTYDTTYNYDQYVNAIRHFDARLGYGDVNGKRQLMHANPPGDTVVTWCYGHRADQMPGYFTGAAAAADLVGAVYADTAAADPAGLKAAAERADAETIARQEKARSHDRTLVLWVDGTVAAMSPYLIRGKNPQDDGNTKRAQYYWVPPFLYSQGVWRQ